MNNNFKEYELELESPWEEGKSYRIIPAKGNYANNGLLAVSLVDAESGEDFAVITTNLGNRLSDPFESSLAFVDANNSDWALKWLEGNKLATPTGFKARSGYCVYPEYRFDLSRMPRIEEVKEHFDNMEKRSPEKIRVVLKEAGSSAKVAEIDNTLESFQERVGGLIDMTSLPGTDGLVDIVCKDDFLFDGSQPNVMTPEYDHVMGGNLIFVGYNPEDGSSISLTDKQVEKVLDYVRENAVDGMDYASAFHLMRCRNIDQKELHGSMTEAEL